MSVENNNTNVLALFDFDGTLTTRDSLFDFLLHSVGVYKFICLMLINIPNFTMLKLGLRENGDAKQRLFSTFFAGWSTAALLNAGRCYSSQRISRIVRPKGITKINQHLNSGHRVILISASLEVWLEHWCQQSGIELLATKVESKDGIVTGKFEGENCYGEEKVRRLEKHLNLENYIEIHAYGDSSGDRQMLELAEFKHYKPFRT